MMFIRTDILYAINHKSNLGKHGEIKDMMRKVHYYFLLLALSLCIGCNNKVQRKAFCENCGKPTKQIRIDYSVKCLRCGETNCMAVGPFIKDEDVTTNSNTAPTEYLAEEIPYTVFHIPEYEGEAVTKLNGNIPTFTIAEKECNLVFEEYAPLDELGRTTKACALLGKETMPTEERGKIGNIKPSGWHTVKYPDIIEDLYLYNRCHLIAHCLSGENDNEFNLITGTRYMNIEGMLPYEIDVANYIEETGNHVLYRATPIYENDELVARGVQLEAYSVEDKGEGISFNVFCHNVQPGILIDYKTGNSERN